jgi:MFS family permease
MAKTHALSSMCDAMIAVALAGSIFFSIDPGAARWRVALYLVLTIAPFAVVTPLIGPAVDRIRGGRRLMIVFTVLGRAVLAYFMSNHIDGLLLFPEAFGFLILQKSYSVAKSAVVPELVRSDGELVQANAQS